MAEEVSRTDLPEEVAAGMPMELFKAEQYMVGKWREYVDGDEASEDAEAES